MSFEYSRGERSPEQPPKKDDLYTRREPIPTRNQESEWGEFSKEDEGNFSDPSDDSWRKVS